MKNLTMAAHVTDSQRDGGSQSLASGHGRSQSPPCSPRGWPPTRASQRATAQHGPEALSHELPHGYTPQYTTEPPQVSHPAPKPEPGTRAEHWVLGEGRGSIKNSHAMFCYKKFQMLPKVKRNQRTPRYQSFIFTHVHVLPFCHSLSLPLSSTFKMK